MKMTEEEAIAQLRHYAPHIRVDYTEAIRTVCDALEGARRAAPDSDDIEWPSYHHQGMGCGLEDRGITDRYEACAYGFQEAVDQCAQAFDNWLALAAAPAQPTVESIIEAFEAGRQSDDCINQYAHGTAEHTAFVHGVNHAYAIKHMLAQLTAQPAPETAGDARDAICDGWVFHSADFSLQSCGAQDDGRVVIIRDEAGRKWWHSLSDAEKETTALYHYGKGKTVAAAIKAAILAKGDAT